MAGYYGFSKSNNAIIAEQDGKVTATQASKILKCSSKAIKELLTPCEWHHTGKYYSVTNYYDISDLIENPEENSELIDKLKSFNKLVDCEVKNGSIKVIDFVRKHKIWFPVERIYDNAISTIKGEWVTIVPENGKSFRKKITNIEFI